MKIVTLSTYPINNPRHGGQHRLLNIVDQYRAAGHEVTACGVLGSLHYPPSPGFVSYPPTTEFNRYIPNPLLMDDWAIGELFALDDRYFAQLSDLLPRDIDLIHVEQPWLFQFAVRHVAERARPSVRLVYGGENVEHKLKRGIVTNYLGLDHAEACAKLVLECELAAIRGADLVCAVSREDADWAQAHATVSVVLAANGASPPPATMEGLGDANGITGHCKFALYSASAHPPNVVGFYDMFDQGVGCIAPNERLVVAGSAGPAIRADPRFARTPGLSRHLVAPGEVTNKCLAGLLANSHAIVLPITHGGGTNLKTAEALWLGHHIVATPVALRGYEQFAQSWGVTVAANAADFRLAVREAMARPAMPLSRDDREARRVVLWERTLSSLVDHVNELDR